MLDFQTEKILRRTALGLFLALCVVVNLATWVLSGYFPLPSLLLGVAGSIPLSFFLGRILRNRLEPPLERLAHQARRLASGNIDVQADSEGFGELAFVYEALCSLAPAIQDHLDTIKKLNAVVKEKEARIESLLTRNTSLEQQLQNSVRAADGLRKRLQEGEDRLDTERAAVKAVWRGRHEDMLNAASTLENVVESITVADSQLEAQIRKTSGNTHRHMERSEEITVSIEEMAATTTEIARNASQAAANVREAMEKATQGSASVAKAVGAIQDVERIAHDLETNTQDLSKRAKGISKIMEFINTIADRTNLLALNATIQAAGVGEAGKGFAVVAGEIKDLANKTMSATADVAESISQIQQGVLGITLSVKDTIQAVGHAVNLAETSGAALDRIVTIYESATDEVLSIATATEQHSVANEEINRTIRDMNTISVDMVQDMDASGEHFDILKSQIRQLTTVIQAFQLLASGELQQSIAQLSTEEDIQSLDRVRMETRLRSFAEENPNIELLYITDHKGVQITDNVSSRQIEVGYGTSGYKENWSSRPWFTGALHYRSTFVSRIYTSEATNDFCVTIASPVINREHKVIAILAADISFASHD